MLITLNEIFNFLFKRVKKSKKINQDLNNSENEVVQQYCSNILLARKLILIVPIAYIIATVLYIIYDTDIFIQTSKMLVDNILTVIIIALSIIGGSLLFMFISLTLLVNKEKREIIKNLFTYIPPAILLYALAYVYCSYSSFGSYLMIAYICISAFYIFMNVVSNMQTIKYSNILGEEIKVLNKSKDTFIALVILAVVVLIAFAPFWFMLIIRNIIL